MYDKITTVRQAALPGGDALPLSLNREVFREYQLQTVEVDLAAAQALLEAGGEAKPAVVKLLLDTDIENARRLLERAEGSVRRAVAD